MTSFLSERDFRGASQKIGEPNSRNFLRVVDRWSHYDPILEKHIDQIKEFQKADKCLQVYYLPSDTQNEFISC